MEAGVLASQLVIWYLGIVFVSIVAKYIMESPMYDTGSTNSKKLLHCICNDVFGTISFPKSL